MKRDHSSLAAPLLVVCGTVAFLVGRWAAQAGPNLVPPYPTPGGAELAKVAAEGQAWLAICWREGCRCLERDVGREAASKSGLVGWGTPNMPAPADFSGSECEFTLSLPGGRVRVRYVRPVEAILTEWVAVPAAGGARPFRVETASGVIECANGMAAVALAKGK